MGTKVSEDELEAHFKSAIRKIIADLCQRKIKFQAFYDDTHEDVYKRMVWRIEQKIKMLEELL
jgi:hypothetical protein